MMHFFGQLAPAFPSPWGGGVRGEGRCVCTVLLGLCDPLPNPLPRGEGVGRRRPRGERACIFAGASL